MKSWHFICIHSRHEPVLTMTRFSIKTLGELSCMATNKGEVSHLHEISNGYV